ncbi:defective in cullin neddylation protein 1 [Trichoderma sp. SZMC 28014]
MPPPSLAQQKMLAQFVSLTGVSERQALRYLKSTGYKLNEAVDAMMLGWKGVKQHLPSRVAKAVPLLLSKKKREKHGADGSAKEDPGRFYMNSANEGKGPSPLDSKLDALFDSLRDDENDEKDKLELESTMGYLSEHLHVSLENAELFVVLELVQAPSVGEITRAGYVSGWKACTGAGASHQEHAVYVRDLVNRLPSESALFKRVYRYAFVAGREKDQKSLALENALIYWTMLFSAPGMAWKGKHDWLELWKTFLDEKWTRSVNRDMWNMILEFALKTLSDESLSFWSEDGAWPSVIDDFVEWCKQKGIGKSETMDVDA